MINPQWLELPMSRTNFHGPKDVWAIEVRLDRDKDIYREYSQQNLINHKRELQIGSLTSERLSPVYFFRLDFYI